MQGPVATPAQALPRIPPILLRARNGPIGALMPSRATDRRLHDFRPHPEELEGRRLLDSSNPAQSDLRAALVNYLRSVDVGPGGVQWAGGDRITYSFVPDGTDVGGVPSSLDRAMAARGL